ncbi:hypothetical protein [Hymenobacter psoromatis]|uniref:hypothetical protein n=1 Tax=Hymenobacter psoromatis TaxID=1484116 RepID=UPI001CBBD465|nr:hypothetical protein [Hymenobacter psoromatis]
MKYFFLSIGWLLVFGPAAAQQARPASAPDLLGAALPTPPAAPDTAAALHRLFAARRRNISVALPLTVGAGAGLFLAVAHTSDAKEGLNWTLLGVITVGFTIGELASIPRYSKRREEMMAEDFKRHRLPASWRRELRQWYFKPTKTIP